MKSLGEQMEDWLNDSEELILLGDFNEDVRSHQMTAFFEEHNMKERVMELVDQSPETHKGNRSGKTTDDTWTTPGLKPVSAGHTDYMDDFDHGMVWVDFEEHKMFGHNKNKLVPIEARRSIPGQAKSVNKCLQNSKPLHKENEIEERSVEEHTKFEENLS